MKPSTRRALALLLSKEWTHGNELFQVAGTRYGGRLDELKALGYTWDKQWRPGSAVPWYRIHPPLTLDHQPGPSMVYVQHDPQADHDHVFVPQRAEKPSKRPAVAPGQMALPGPRP